MNQPLEPSDASNTSPSESSQQKYPRWIFFSWGSMLIFAALIAIVAVLIYPSTPEIPSYQNLKKMEGILTYQVKTGQKKGTYYIEDRALECPEAIRLYPFASCPITIEIKAADQKLAKAYWYSQSFMGFPYAMLVELAVDKNNSYLNLQGIKVLEYDASKEIIEKLHQQRKSIYQYSLTLLIGTLLLGMVFLILMMFYYRGAFEKLERKLKLKFNIKKLY